MSSETPVEPIIWACSCDGCWDCHGHEPGCTCDVDWDKLVEQRLGQ